MNCTTASRGNPVLAIAASVLLSLAPYRGEAAPQPRLLVFSKIAPGGFAHSVIPLATATVMKIGAESGVTVDTTTDSRQFTKTNLARYQAILFNHCFGDVLDPDQEAAFQAFIRGGGGYAGLHASSYVELTWPWYKQLVGAYFVSHSAVMPGTITVEDRAFPVTPALPAKWTRSEEWYNFDVNPRPGVKVLLTVDEKTYTGGNMGPDHPIAWYHAYDGGRAWYSALGHTPESYSEREFLAHLRAGLFYALGAEPPTALRAPGKPIVLALPAGGRSEIPSLFRGVLFRNGAETFSVTGARGLPR